MNIRVQKRENPFLQIDKTPINDRELSAGALGVLTYLLSKPDGWKANKNEIISRFKGMTKNGIETALRELRHAGYAKLSPLRSGVKGKVIGTEYLISELPVFQKHTPEPAESSDVGELAEVPTSSEVGESSTVGKSDAYSNNELLSNNELVVKENEIYKEELKIKTPALPPAELKVMEALLKAERYFQQWPDQQQMMCERAKRSDALHPKVFRDTLEAWIRYNIDNPAIICHIETSITKSFQAWLTRNLEANNRSKNGFARPAGQDAAPTAYKAPVNQKLQF